ncbi:MAG: DUF2250 domain-containing protein [bacterium]|nr:DUF2250 domain-containing protein [bacterium]
MTRPELKEQYTLAKCCSPAEEDNIVGYYSYDNRLKVHREDCPNLAKAEAERLVALQWSEILEDEGFVPGNDYDQLDETDFAILRHHLEYDIDYSLIVAKMLSIPKQDAFERHRQLRDLKLLERVDAVMVRYRKGVVDNKWIKHRNHTYFRLTPLGRKYLDYRNRSLR